MNALVSKPVLEHAMSVLMSAASGNSTKASCGRLPVSSFAMCMPFVSPASSANPSLHWMYQRPHEYVTCFPELVSAFGERAFSGYWGFQ
jgi:hypothetical protein